MEINGKEYELEERVKYLVDGREYALVGFIGRRFVKLRASEKVNITVKASHIGKIKQPHLPPS